VALVYICIGVAMLLRSLLGAKTAAARLEQGLQAAGIPGPDFPYRPQGVQFCGTAACSGAPSQQAVGVWESIAPTGFWKGSPVVLPLAQENKACWQPEFPAQAQFCVAVARGTEPAGLFLLLPMEQWGAIGPAYTGALVSLVFQGEGSRLCIREECGAPSSYMCQAAGLTAE
jgi:hypothetical protein